MSELADALGRGTKVEFGTVTLSVEPLDFNDLIDLEEFSGQDADTLEIAEFIQSKRNRLFFLWLVLRKADPKLTSEERERGEYRMTEKEAGYILKRNSDTEQIALIAAAIGLSGLKETEDAADPKPAPAEVPAKAKKEKPVPAASSPS